MEIQESSESEKSESLNQSNFSGKKVLSEHILTKEEMEAMYSRFPSFYQKAIEREIYRNKLGLKICENPEELHRLLIDHKFQLAQNVGNSRVETCSEPN